MFNPGDTFPYIGLRPFSEDDSLYFKGRDEQILQLTALLEANKFLMVTGASGDGKSSLVYAGLVPNARAGFFKAKHPNWVVADFRPERSPLSNLSKTISRNLRIGNEDSVEVELRRGFSSLVELYLSSGLNLDEQSDEWVNASEDERDDLQRKAANLLIVADQFEEFFTNPENYYKNSPSADSQLVINLLLETARISIKKNLPIYIVCTMRSDYIGQCAAFRGLPEFIGFSQFFVPRLKRKEMVQVVKEPAFLHGDKITNRLAERIVYDLGEGIDQLPVLEHAMNEVWIQAKHGHEELDLIHYAMAGGMSPEELPVEYRNTFDAWFKTLPVKLQEAYQHPGLSQIIDTHANKLYLSAADHYNQHHPTKISTAEAQLIIKVAFTCLTKMDEDRAVRNRMTLQEITNILDQPKLTSEVVGGVLNIFRETGNTFLRPYISDDPESRELKPDSVLDITHESLIRNWELLLSWAKEEYDHLTVYEDFKKQLDRWIESNKSGNFLLPIGPLTFFENWHATLKPNKFWINRYLDPGLDMDARLKKAQQIIDDTNEFLNRSARKVRVTRMIVKYGATRIAAILGVILVIGLCGFYYWDADQKKNENVVNTILREGRTYMGDPRFNVDDKADFLINAEYHSPGAYREILDNLPGNERFDLILATYFKFVRHNANPWLRKSLLLYGDSLLTALKVNKENAGSLMERMKSLNILVMTSSHYLSFYEDNEIERVLQRSVTQSKDILGQAYSQSFSLDSLQPALLADGLENVLNNNGFTHEEAEALTGLISPFEGPQGKENFHKYFPSNKLINISNGNNFRHNAGYQLLAYLYGYLGNLETVTACVDSLLKYHPNYSTFRNNVVNIAAYLFKGGHITETDKLLASYAQKQKVLKKDLYEYWLNNSGYMYRHVGFKLNTGINHNANLELLDYHTIINLFDEYFKLIHKEYTTPDELNFNLALYYKHRGIMLAKIDADKQGRRGFNPEPLYKEALAAYQKVSWPYLDQHVEVYIEDTWLGQITKQSRKRKELFLYPDHYPKVPDNRHGQARYFHYSFFEFLLRSGKFPALFTQAEDYSYLIDWVTAYNRYVKPDYFSQHIKNFVAMPLETLARVDSVLSGSAAASGLNSNLVRLILMDEYYKIGNLEKADALFQKLDFARLHENLQQGNPNDLDVVYYRIMRLAQRMAYEGRRNLALKTILTVPGTSNVIRSYAIVPLELLRKEGGAKMEIFVYLDSTLTELDRLTDFFFFGPDPRFIVILTTGQMGGMDMINMAKHFAGKLSIGQQSGAIENLVLGIALSGDYFKAYTAIPPIALIDRLTYYNIILSVEGEKKSQDVEWTTYFIRYVDWQVWDFVSFAPEVF